MTKETQRQKHMFIVVQKSTAFLNTLHGRDESAEWLKRIILHMEFNKQSELVFVRVGRH